MLRGHGRRIPCPVVPGCCPAVGRCSGEETPTGGINHLVSPRRPAQAGTSTRRSRTEHGRAAEHGSRDGKSHADLLEARLQVRSIPDGYSLLMHACHTHTVLTAIFLDEYGLASCAHHCPFFDCPKLAYPSQPTIIIIIIIIIMYDHHSGPCGKLNYLGHSKKFCLID